MKEVLILGNGLSRLLYKDFIDQWKGELWGCNGCYTEYGDRLTRLTGHLTECSKALEAKKLNGYTYEILCGKKTLHEGMNPFSFEKKVVGNSGINLVIQAFYEEYDKIYLCGFDLGGADIHSPEHHVQNKQKWIVKFRKFLGSNPDNWDKIVFIGYDHKPYLMSDEPPDKYFKLYSIKQSHIPDEAYKKLLREHFNQKE